MTEREWDTLFNLIEKAINQPGMSATEKGDHIREKAEARGESGNLEEFLAQCDVD